jgi:integrase
MAIKVRQYISSIFQYAVITQRADADPAAVLRGVVAKPATEHSRALSVDELSGIYRGLPKYQSRRTTLAIKLPMMLFPRTIELCRAEWGEIDLDAAEWRIPAEKIRSLSPSWALPGGARFINHDQGNRRAYPYDSGDP